MKFTPIVYRRFYVSLVYPIQTIYTRCTRDTNIRRTEDYPLVRLEKIIDRIDTLTDVTYAGLNHNSVQISYVERRRLK